MTKIFLDTNIWLRYFLKDNDQYYFVQKLIEAIEEGNFLPYTSGIVFLELAYVLERTYKLPHKKVCEHLEAVSEIRNLTILDSLETKKVLKTFNLVNVKYADCLIAAQIPEDMLLVSFDRDFTKFPALKLTVPKDLLQK